MKKELILMMGGQGSGKGTLSKIMMQEKPYNYVETGAMLRALPDNSPVKQIMARGELVPDSELEKLLTQKITPANDTILDGFPRKLSQAEWLVQNFADKFDMIALYLNIPRELMIKRIQNRINEGVGRADDADTAVVQRRLDSFFNHTLPAIEWLKTVQGIKFADIPIQDAPADENYKQVKAVLEQLRKTKTR